MSDERIANSRAEAQDLGLKLYHGRPCPQGHTIRRASDKKCRVCRGAKERRRRRRLTEQNGEPGTVPALKPYMATYRGMIDAVRRNPNAIPEDALDFNEIVELYKARILRDETSDQRWCVAAIIPYQLGGTFSPANLALMTMSQVGTKTYLEGQLVELLTNDPDPLGTLREHRKTILDLAADLPTDVAERLLDHVTELAEQL